MTFKSNSSKCFCRFGSFATKVIFPRLNISRLLPWKMFMVKFKSNLKPISSFEEPNDKLVYFGIISLKASTGCNGY